ncbi:MAG: hypothetical protein Q4G59_02295, partial [Planctomycetia bacterium]|nr:hypothetical protein [Planctomycetia bacterium]
EKYLLPVVESPLSQEEFQLLEACLANVNIPVVTCTWQKAAVQTGKLEELAFFDDGEPTTNLKRRIESMNNRIETPAGLFVVHRQLNDNWELTIIIEDENGNSPAVQHVRLQAIGALRDRDDPCLWRINLKYLTQKNRVRLLAQESLHISCVEGFVIVVRTDS